MTIVLNGPKRPVPLFTASRPEQFRPLQITLEMRAVLEQCEARRIGQQKQGARHETS